MTSVGICKYGNCSSTIVARSIFNLSEVLGGGIFFAGELLAKNN